MTSAPRLWGIGTEVDDLNPVGGGIRLRRRRASQTQDHKPDQGETQRPGPKRRQSPCPDGILGQPRQLGSCPGVWRSLGSMGHSRELTGQGPQRIDPARESTNPAVTSIAVGIRRGYRAAATIGARGSQHFVSQGLRQRIRALTQRMDDGPQPAPLHRAP